MMMIVIVTTDLFQLTNSEVLETDLNLLREALKDPGATGGLQGLPAIAGELLKAP